MAYISLYRKWRPQTFSELVGQNHVAKTLENAIKSNRVAHAYLFSGPRGTGKTSTAKILAKAINCDNGPTAKPCQKCDNCLKITDGTSLDVLEIDAASNRGIDEIRDLREKAKFVPSGASKKVYIIDEVHMLTHEAFNALLKLLEEPPSHVIFVLATTEPSKVLSTIISRCQRFDFRRILFPDLVKHLEKVAIKEKIDFEHAAIEIIAKQAQGGLRDALGLLDQLASYSEKKIKKSDVIDLLGLIGTKRLFQAVDIIEDQAADKIFSFADELSNEGRDFRQFVRELIEHSRNLFILQNGGHESVIPATTEDIADLKKQAEKLSHERVRRFLDIFGQALIEMKIEGDHKLVFELSMLQLMHPQIEHSIDAISERLSRLEEKPTSQVLGQKPNVQQEDEVEEDKINESIDTVTDDTAAIATSENSDKNIYTEMTKRELERFWPTLMAKIKQKSLPIHAILMECQPLEVDDGNLLIGLSQDWQRGLLEKTNSINIISSSLKDILGKDYRIKFKIVPKGDIADDLREKVEISDDEPIIENADNNADDALKMLHDSFGAEVINEVD